MIPESTGGDADPVAGEAAPEKKSFDIASLDTRDAQEEGIVVELEHPATGLPIGWRWRVAGPDSERQKRARAEVHGMRKKRRNPLRQMSDAELEEEGIQILARSVISWEFDDEAHIDGKKPPCTVQNAIDALRRFGAIREQLALEALDRAGFTKS